ncbi:Polysaccharide biosynthesis/export protein [Methyloligella halotolerans]|uniref:Polysaccharide biosynthesis/export protein n=1 Tax=Methyloligella halotolerans TaxID=1177755 RepID=A0A1E2S2J4_9HYPH|nr:Polysaccharide biosynthesis/export protein [Methyloligella halotolerans]
MNSWRNIGFVFVRLLLLSAVLGVGLGGCNMRGFPRLNLPAPVFNTPSPLPPPGQYVKAPAGAIPGAPVPLHDTYRLDSGDELRIVVFGQQNLSRVYAVDGSGYISMPLLGSIRARGLTTRQLAGVIERDLGAEYVKNPKVSVEVQTYRPFYILGEVQRAGKYPYVSGMTVEEAVATAEAIRSAPTSGRCD